MVREPVRAGTNSTHAVASASTTAAIPPASHRMRRGKSVQRFNISKRYGYRL